MPTYRLDLKYNGTSYHGWQTQIDQKAVQDYLNRALEKLFDEPVTTLGASRTDSGVHADQQVVSFQSQKILTRDNLIRGANSMLPETIRVTEAQQVDEGFHPIASALGKIYCYKLWTEPVQDPFMAPFAWHFPFPLDLERLRKGAVEFIGEHDFSAFCNEGSSAKTRTRTIFEFKIREKPGSIEFWISGNGFLKQMIRIMVGSLVEYAENRLEVRSIKELIRLQDRKKAGRTAPPNGLTLACIFYDKIIGVDEFLDSPRSGPWYVL